MGGPGSGPRKRPGGSGLVPATRKRGVFNPKVRKRTGGKQKKPKRVKIR